MPRSSILGNLKSDTIRIAGDGGTYTVLLLLANHLLFGYPSRSSGLCSPRITAATAEQTPFKQRVLTHGCAGTVASDGGLVLKVRMSFISPWRVLISYF